MSLNLYIYTRKLSTGFKVRAGPPLWPFIPHRCLTRTYLPLMKTYLPPLAQSAKGLTMTLSTLAPGKKRAYLFCLTSNMNLTDVIAKLSF